MRKNEVTFSITPAPNTEATEERAKRLALFVSTIGERPESFLQLIKEPATPVQKRLIRSELVIRNSTRKAISVL